MQAVYSYNVGFGNACLVIKEETVILIDAGHLPCDGIDYQEVVNDIAARIITYAQRLIVVITHRHVDHFSLIENILGAVIERKPNLKENILILTGGCLSDSDNDAEKSIPRGEKLLNFFIKEDLRYYSVVLESQKKALQGTSTDFNPVTAAEVNSEIIKDNEIRIIRAYDDRDLIKYSSLPRSHNDNTIMVGIMFTLIYGDPDTWEEKHALLFMGDASAREMLLADRIREKLRYISQNNFVMWYQVPHHGSANNGECRWLSELLSMRSMNHFIARSIGVFSTKAAYYKGIPNASAVNTTIGCTKLSAEEIKGARIFTAVENDNLKEAKEYWCDDWIESPINKSRNPAIYSTADSQMLIPESQATGIYSEILD